MEPNGMLAESRAHGISAEDAVRMSDAIIAISADAIISIDESQKIIRYNSGAEEIFGYAPSEILGQSIDLLIPERFRSTHPAQIEGFARSPTVARRMGERRQISGLRRNGQEFPAEASISKARLGDQWVFTVALRDITDRVRSQRSQEFLAQATAVLNGSLDAESTIANIAALSLPLLGDWCVVFLTESNGGFRRALAVHSLPDHAPLMEALVRMPFRPRPEHPLLPCLSDGETVHIVEFSDDVITAWADSAEHAAVMRALDPASVLAVPLQARGRQTGAITFFLDRKSGRLHDEDDIALARELARRAGIAVDNARLYEVARDAVQARDDVLAVVSHDLGNPLSAIRLSARVLSRLAKRDNAVDPALAEQAENISLSVQQMERLIKDLLDIKRIESGFLALDVERVSVHALLDEVRDSFAALAETRGIALETEMNDADAFVLADRERVLQVFSNLVGNALKFTGPGERVTIRASASAGGVEFQVADTGPGIPQEHLPHIFDRFWQARRTGRQSIGLGLAIVKGIVDAHRGTMRVDSEVGAGTTFCFTLPLG